MRIVLTISSVWHCFTEAAARRRCSLCLYNYITREDAREQKTFPVKQMFSAAWDRAIANLLRCTHELMKGRRAKSGVWRGKEI